MLYKCHDPWVNYSASLSLSTKLLRPVLYRVAHLLIYHKSSWSCPFYLEGRKSNSILFHHKLFARWHSEDQPRDQKGLGQECGRWFSSTWIANQMRRPVSLDGRIWKKVFIYVIYLCTGQEWCQKKIGVGVKGWWGDVWGGRRKVFLWVQRHFSWGNLALILTFREKLKIFQATMWGKITFLTIEAKTGKKIFFLHLYLK